MGERITAVAGATGHLGGLIARSLRDRGERVRAIVRAGSADGKALQLRQIGVTVVEADYDDPDQLAEACQGASCVVSALAGLRDVIIDAQTELLEAAVSAGVPRFIASDFAIDFYKMPDGHNRNLDLRREFAARLDRAPIAATSILNGMFAEMLTGQAPFILAPIKRVAYWENADQPMDFTTIANTAAFTAAAALEPTTPRFLRIAGDVVTARDLAAIVSSVTGDHYKLLRAGSLGRLEKLIAVTRTLSPGTDEVYPPWQGMQYMRDMFDGRAKLEPLDNARYPGLLWTSVRDILEGHERAAETRRRAS
ncbi:MAG TPA: NmrA family NAD(P)-binding protein [Gemmatimonadaceae bacterium]|nr:NmrA family NAD(P)-binding protein [Gemmatimonadaceae bacterium]